MPGAVRNIRKKPVAKGQVDKCGITFRSDRRFMAGLRRYATTSGQSMSMLVFANLSAEFKVKVYEMGQEVLEGATALPDAPSPDMGREFDEGIDAAMERMTESISEAMFSGRRPDV